MITASGAEGINLKNVRYVHIMEPYWHPVRVEQVIGRARRICSHKDLPKSLQTIETFTYISVFSDEQKQQNKFKEIKRKDRYMTSDEKLLSIMYRKQSVNQSLLNVLKEVSIDCTLNMDKSEKRACFRIPDSTSSDVFMTKPDFKERSGESKITVKQVATKFMEYGDNGNIIDKEKFEKDGTIDIVGKVVIDKDGKKRMKRVSKPGEKMKIKMKKRPIQITASQDPRAAAEGNI